eukprot:Protomagalhaensia_sp_Gyna_25__1316@NODE_165_length_4702_cov_205_856959_g128_i0_p1_GENE_NODE_165_length_4702_cov_205_856959_g128_i0NODE_165_length_4702_cov_205_856959_g128_i0_p1_ORF_typecomplete_len533_score118_56Cpn60_TCP1/PF00118_24/4_5e158TPR_MalT/PF17874_1/1_8e03TPR_MalT/PF17874_1/0_32_NODE_165_length_4702_cov_205_856959_g128_i013162914
MAQVAPQILQQGGHEDKGENARLQCFVGATAIGDMMKSTLGPKGMDKILQPLGGEGSHLGKTSVTNDGATILRSVWLDNPAAKILVDVSRQQDSLCGDGTTGVVVLAAELLRGAEKLVDRKIHPQTIIEGFRMATQVARRRLLDVSFGEEVGSEEMRENLLKIAKTTLSSKLLNHEKEHFASLAVEAVLRLKEKNNLNLIQILKKKGGSIRDSYLDEGFILEKKIGVGQPRVMTDCKVMVANTPMDADKIKIFGAKVAAEDFDTVAEIEAAEKEKMKQKVDKILAHGCNVFINRQLIYNYPDQLFKDAKVMAIEHSDFDGMERLAAALGAEIVSTFDTPDASKLGGCEKIEEILIGEDRAIKFSGCRQKEACTIVLRGASEHVLDEAERSLHDALAVVSQTCQEPAVVFGGGAAEMAMADSVDRLARTVEGRKSLAIEAFAEALRQIPTILLDNGGFDSAEVVAKLRALHTSGSKQSGVDMNTGDVGDMKQLGVFESYKSKLSQLVSAVEAAEQIIRVDDVIRCAPRRREGM